MFKHPTLKIKQGMTVRALSVSDLLFLFLEKPKQPMHFSGLCLFEVPPDTDSRQFLRQLIQDTINPNTSPSFPFNQVLHRWVWQTDKHFDITKHFFHVHLSNLNSEKTDNIHQLFDYISQKHSELMDKSKPLWEFHLIDGIQPIDANSPPRFAIWLKIHHSMADGVASMRLLRLSLSRFADVTASLPFWSLPQKNRHHIDDLLHNQRLKKSLIKEQLATIKPVARELWQGFKDNLDKNSPFVSTFDAPKSILNQTITSHRHISADSFDKQRFAKLAKQFGTTTNDVVLAVCAGALRSYLLQENALPSKPLIAFVPISLRRDDSISGNQISFLLVNLGTHLSDPVARLRTIKNSIDDGKARFGRMTGTQIINYSACVYGWAGINLATGLAPTYQAFNLVISSVPADDSPLYLNGAKLTGIYPASVLFDGQAMNITLTNHQDKIDFGITACATALPRIGNFLDLLTNELEMFEKWLMLSDELIINKLI